MRINKYKKLNIPIQATGGVLLLTLLIIFSINVEHIASKFSMSLVKPFVYKLSLSVFNES